MAAPICSYCQAPVAEDAAVATCPACGAVYHAECWAENEGCAAYGCTHAAEVKPRTDLEIPASWWGQEEKPCPACGQSILAAAIRCRHCGASFASSRPEAAAEFQQRARQLELVPELRRKVIWLFVLSAIPFTAPIGAGFGLVWYRARRPDIEQVPGIYPALGLLGFLLGLVQTGAVVLFAAWYVVRRL